MNVQLANELFSKPWFILPSGLEGLQSKFIANAGMLPGEPEDDECAEPEYDVEDGIACIPIHGILVKRENWFDSLSGLQSYEQLTEWIEEAATNPDVKGILLNVESPGGQVAGCADLTNLIYSVRKLKPIYAVADDYGYSAAYMLASAADQLYLTREGGVGSIGCVIQHADLSKMYQQMGVNLEYVFSGAKKIDGRSDAPLSKEVRAEWQVRVDDLRSEFAQVVARNRSVSVDALLATEAGCFYGQQGIPLLADRVGTFEDAKRDMLAMLGSQAEESPADRMITEAQKLSVEAMRDAWDRGWAGAGISEKPAVANSYPVGFYDLQISEKAPWRGDISRVISILGYTATPKQPAAGAIFPDGRVLCLRSAVSQYSASDSRISCRVAPYNSLSCDLGGFKEIYQPGCFAESLNAPDDIRVLFQHDSKYVLGCRSAGTARFYDGADGLHFDVDPPKTQWADDLLVSMGRGDIRQGSAAWFCLKDRWERRNGERVRIIEKALLVEASITGFAAYGDTEATVSRPQQQESLAAAAASEHELLSTGLQLLSIA